MNWTDDYIGLPFREDGRDREGLDCWGLVRLVYSERLGVDLPAYSGEFTDSSRATLRKVAALMEERSRLWREVPEPREYDVVLLRAGQLYCHVGLFVPRHDLLHIEAGIDSAREPLTSPRRRHSVVGYFRHG